MIKQIIVKTRDYLFGLRNSVFGSKDYKKFIVITRSRTGSNLLISLLNSHLGIKAGGELFRRLENKSSTTLWNEIFSKKPKGIKYVGFKIFYYHPLDNDNKDVWDYIKKDKTIKLIHLTRKNMLRTVVSREIADKTDTWTNKHGKNIEINDKRVSLDIKKCFEEFEITKSHEKRVREEFKRDDFIELTYEDLVKNNQNSINDIFDFLELERKSVKSSYKKQNKESLQDLIINYDELNEAMSTSKWSYLMKLENS